MSARLFFCALLTFLVLLVAGSSRPVSASPPLNPNFTSSILDFRLPHLPFNPKPKTENLKSPDWDPACYSTYTQVDTFLHNQATLYPQIVTLLDGGLAWEGTRHVWALKLTSSIHPDPKPDLFLIAGQHPRDIATTEMLLRLITYLTHSYGNDPDVTWLLDNRTLTIIPAANPDGYAQVPMGLNQFKNFDNNYCTNSINRGADINRNYPFQWNTVGTSPLACDLSYPGPSSLSEPESSAILSLLQLRSPRGHPDFGLRINTTGSQSAIHNPQSAIGNGLLINLQATGPGILYPWGYTPVPPPDAPGLYALGSAFGRLNGTPPSQVRTENSHLPISGIIDDTAYALYGIPAYTLNIGTTQSPLCTDLDPIWNAQRPAFIFAAKSAALDLPYYPLPRLWPRRHLPYYHPRLHLRSHSHSRPFLQHRHYRGRRLYSR